jgi:bacillithiol biosynthesis cysteine-adding enzyme BshC
MFWIASEDHDWEEANHTHLLDVQNELMTLRLPLQEGVPGRPLHRIPLHSGMEDTLSKFLDVLPSTDFSSPLFDLVRSAYPPGATLPQGFLALFQGLLAEYPLVFVDSAHPELKAASLPVLFREWEAAEAHETLLARVASHLELEGYPIQVPILEGGVNLFFEGPGGRNRIYREGDDARLHRSGDVVPWDEVRSSTVANPTLLSPNVLLRPIVESELFPTLSYVGGPGEIAYFGQLKELFQAHGIRMPVVYPRGSATLVEGKIGKVLDKFRRTHESLDRPFHELAAEVALEEVPPAVRQALGELRGAVGKGTGALAKAVQELDPTLRGPVTHARNTAFAAFDEAERKILQALKRENEIALEQLQKAQKHLYPMGRPQERVLNPFYYLTRYGPGLVSALMNEFAVDLGIETA